ncbi:uncharacterized protein LOC135147233 [Daucus carota subsp. sativus]|uniref:uncharacterized protein LOC135147233 n=1 Tax=Daucus carota subsp. sativus TaxID=79200 RepID=UPI00308299EF
MTEVRLEVEVETEMEGLWRCVGFGGDINNGGGGYGGGGGDDGGGGSGGCRGGVGQDGGGDATVVEMVEVKVEMEVVDMEGAFSYVRWADDAGGEEDRGGGEDEGVGGGGGGMEGAVEGG